LITNPISPIALIPRKHIFTDSQSSLLPGFTASFNVLAHWDKNDLRPMFHRTLNISFVI